MAAAVFLCVPSFAVLGLAVVLLAAAAALVALAAPIVAMPYVFARSRRRHWRKGVAAGQALHRPLHAYTERKVKNSEDLNQPSGLSRSAS